MQNDQNSTSATTPVSDQGLWITREEYDRLQQTQSAQTQPAAFQTAQFTADDPSARMRMTLAILAILLFMTFTVPFLGLLTVPLILIFGVMAIARMSKASTRARMSRNEKTIIWLLLSLIMAPVIGMAALFIMLMVFLSAGGGAGS